MLCFCCSVGKVRLDTALELSLYLSKETEIMAVTQGFGELVPLYKLMEKRDMAALENQMKVSEGNVHVMSQNIQTILWIVLKNVYGVSQVNVHKTN